MYPDGSRDNAPKTHARKDVAIVGLQRHQQVAWIEKKNPSKLSLASKSIQSEGTVS
jgi:hypothetical protein